MIRGVCFKYLLSVPIAANVAVSRANGNLSKTYVLTVLFIFCLEINMCYVAPPKIWSYLTILQNLDWA